MPPKDANLATTVASVAAATTLFIGVAVSASPVRGILRLSESEPSAIRSQGRSMFESALMNVRSSSRMPFPIVPPAWLAEAEKSLADLGRLPDRWGGSEKPSELAIRMAQTLVRSMERHGHRVLDVAPMADGGIAVIYAEDVHSAHFDVYNDGGIVVVTQRRHGEPAQYIERPETEAVAEMSRFLQHDDDATPAG